MRASIITVMTTNEPVKKTIDLQHNVILSRFTSAKIEKNRGNNKKNLKSFVDFIESSNIGMLNRTK